MVKPIVYEHKTPLFYPDYTERGAIKMHWEKIVPQATAGDSMGSAWIDLRFGVLVLSERVVNALGSPQNVFIEIERQELKIRLSPAKSDACDSFALIGETDAATWHIRSKEVVGLFDDSGAGVIRMSVSLRGEAITLSPVTGEWL